MLLLKEKICKLYQQYVNGKLTCGHISKLSRRASIVDLNNFKSGSFANLSIFLAADLVRVLWSTKVPRNCKIK
jgi:hypothetical protein